MNTNNVLILLLLLWMLVATIPPAFARSCDITERMKVAQQQEQQRRLNGINAGFQWLQRLNDLERVCLENFPAYPTQWLTNSAVLIVAFNKIKQSSCRALAAKIRHTSQRTIDEIKQDITPSNPLIKQRPNTINATNAADILQDQPSTGITGILKRLFR